MDFGDFGTTNITGKGYGVYVDNGSIEGNPLNITATGANSIGLYAANKSYIHAANNITATASNGVGLVALSGAQVWAFGNVTAKACGISAQGTGTRVMLGSFIEVSVDGKNGVGVYAGAGSDVVSGGVTHVSSTGTGGVGVHADGGRIDIGGDIKAVGTGAVATAGGEVSVDGWITKNGRKTTPEASVPPTYVKTGTKAKKITDNSPTTKTFCKTYTDGTSAVWVWDNNKGYDYTTGIPVQDAGEFNEAIKNTQNPYMKTTAR